MDPKEEEKLLRWYNEVESEESNLKSSQNYNIDEKDEEIESEAEESSRQTTRDLDRQSIHDDNKLGESSGETSKNRGHPNRRQYQDLESDEEEPFPASDSEYEPSSESETESEQESEIDDNDEDVDGDVNQPTIIAWNEVDGTSLKQFTFIDSGQINMYCSKACQEDAELNEKLLENAQLLEKENEELLQVLEQRDDYINRTITIKEQINTDAIEMEEFFTRQLEERISRINLGKPKK
ncbi:unnamed protein product [Ceutorhynchus assimilis]|uniref:Uncharacterized protein n=1 Tax=Ceutorhynchus assimilis TaxID=467358 RepID=A0A9N9QQF2_9CUCU|nr:unnamed protein product [Ceutorhynchus assimilis]